MLLNIHTIPEGRIGQVSAQLMRPDHWLHRYECPGRWQGEGADLLGLKHPVREAHLIAVLQGRTPDGRVRLVENAPGTPRHAGWVLNFQSPPDVNALHAVAPIHAASQIEKSHAIAVKAALDDLQTRLEARSGAGLLGASFQHRISSSQTPSLHTRVVVAGLGFQPNGHVRAFSSGELTGTRDATERIYVAAYTQHLETRLKLQLNHGQEGHFRIVGVPQEASRLLAQPSGDNRRLESLEARRGEPGRARTDFRARWNDISRHCQWTTEHARYLLEHTRTHHTSSEKSKTQSQGHTH